MTSIKFLGVKFCTESFITGKPIIVLSLNFLAYLAWQIQRGLEAPLPHPGITRTKHPGLTVELYVLTGLTAEFPQVAQRTSTRIILTANVDQHADWSCYEEYCLSQVLCRTDHLIIQLTYPEFH